MAATHFRGDLAGVDGEDIHVDDRKAGRLTFPFSALGHAKLLLTDRLIALHRPHQQRMGRTRLRPSRSSLNDRKTKNMAK